MINTDISNATNIMLGATQVSAMYIGNTLVWSNNTVPYDAEIEYLESDGFLYIDTGILITSTDFEIGYTAEGFGTWGWVHLGNAGGTWVTTQNRSSNNTYTWWTGNFNRSNSTGYLNGFYTIKYKFEEGITINGSSSFFLGNFGNDSISNISLRFFSRYDFGSNGMEFSADYSCKIKSFYIKVGGTLVRDFIPVRVGQTGYMYDKISRLLFSNEGSGNFVLGPDKLPSGYTLVKYIASTLSGSLYIDLNIMLYDTLNKNYDIAIKYNVIGIGSDNTQPTLFGCLNTTNPWPGTFIRMSLTSATVTTGRYIGGTAKDNTLGNNGTDIELPVQNAPNKNVTSLNNSGQTHTWGTSLFCTFNSLDKTSVNRFIEAKLYYFKLFVEGILVRDMVPCIDPNNVVGLYDLVNNVFYSSPNGAAFVAGPAE